MDSLQTELVEQAYAEIATIGFPRLCKHNNASIPVYMMQFVLGKTVMPWTVGSGFNDGINVDIKLIELTKYIIMNDTIQNRYFLFLFHFIILISSLGSHSQS